MTEHERITRMVLQMGITPTQAADIAQLIITAKYQGTNASIYHNTAMYMRTARCQCAECKVVEAAR